MSEGQLNSPGSAAAHPSQIERPPGPARVPLFGQSLSFSRDPLAFLSGLGRDYGDIAYFKLGSIDGYFLNHPDYVREALIAQRASFSITPFRARLELVVGQGLFASQGELHARQRRLMQPVLRKSRVEAHIDQMAALAQRSRDRWSAGDEIDVADEMMKLAMFIATKVLFNHEIEGDSDDVSKNLTVVMEAFTRIMSPFLSFALKLPIPSTLRFRRAVRELDAVIYRMIEQRRNARTEGEDLLSLLMRAKDDETNLFMTEKQLRDELLTLLIAGHETTANLLIWTIYLLAQNPEADALLHAEARSVLGGATGYDAARLDRLVYTKKVLLEGLRIYPPSWFFGRAALADVRIGPYTVPKGSVVMMSQYVMHRDRRFYDQPEQFRPERWTDEFQAKLPRGAYFPFSAGDRHCIGEGFAWQEALLILATLAERWRFELVPGQSIRCMPSLTLRPEGAVRMIVRPR